MTADERLEALLNRAGQTISDLPENYSNRLRIVSALDATWNWCDRHNVDHYEPTALYILHLTDIIDRMETALENVCGERDWMKSIFEKLSGCPACVYWKSRECEFDDDACCPGVHCLFEYSSVPEDWRVDDGE